MRALALAALLVPLAAGAFELGVKVQPVAAMPLASPQADLYGIGGGAWVKGAVGFRFVELQLTAAYLAIVAAQPGQPTGGALAIGGGARVQRPHGPRGTFFPWLDGDLLYVRTGPLDRFGFAVAVGGLFPLGRARAFWLGPFLRYFQIVQPGRPGFDDGDAKIALVGLSGEWGRAR